MISKTSLTRRDFLRLGITASWTLAAGACDSSSSTSPGDQTSEFRGFNVHPYAGGLLNIQLQALRDIRANWTRTTLGMTRDVAGAYATATGTNVLGLIGDFQLTSIPKNDWPDIVDVVIRRYPSIQYFQILNEPEIFYDMSNTEYVRDYLRPAHDLIRSKFPSLKIVAAAPIGQPSGIQDFVAMSVAGADDYCDFRAVHIYFDQDLGAPWSAFRIATQKPIMITETGSSHPEQHLLWWQMQIPEMKRVLETDYVFYYALLEQPVLTGFEIITGELDNQGNVVPNPRSELYNFLKK